MIGVRPHFPALRSDHWLFQRSSPQKQCSNGFLAIMAITCLFGFHKWDGCKCNKCGACRDVNHDWSENCERCSRCFRVRLNAHSWKNMKCVNCSMARQDYMNSLHFQTNSHYRVRRYITSKWDWNEWHVTCPLSESEANSLVGGYIYVAMWEGSNTSGVLSHTGCITRVMNLQGDPVTNGQFSICYIRTPASDPGPNAGSDGIWQNIGSCDGTTTKIKLRRGLSHDILVSHIVSTREGKRVCVMCGKPLKFIQRLVGVRSHKNCITFVECST